MRRYEGEARNRTRASIPFRPAENRAARRRRPLRTLGVARGCGFRSTPWPRRPTGRTERPEGEPTGSVNRKDVKNEGRSHDMYENKGSSDKMSGEKADIFGN
jgi:hypothetical protein